MNTSRAWTVYSVAVALAMSVSSGAEAGDACAADVNDDGEVNGGDLATLLGSWGPCVDCAADVDDSGAVDAADLGTLLGFWEARCGALPWASVLEVLPDPDVVTNATLRDAIVATGLPWRVRDTASEIEMLLIPPGTFSMGCSASSLVACEPDEGPIHMVTITAPFYIGRYEVTQTQWTALMGSNPSIFHQYDDSPDRPVETVSWNAVQGFLSATGLRLPTEAEWEYAYRAGTTTAFHSGPGFPDGTNIDARVDLIAWFVGNNGPCCEGPTTGTKAVGQKAANGFGLHDMSGNVFEFVSDWYSSTYYAISPAIDPQGPATGTDRVIRSFSWMDNAGGVRSSNRHPFPPQFGNLWIGFRVARTP